MGQSNTEQSDSRENSRLLDRVLAVKLVLASRPISTDDRLIKMIDWILESDGDLEPNGNISVRVFIDAIRATGKRS